MSLWDDFLSQGWLRFGADPEIADWASHAQSAGRAALIDPVNAQWHQCENTWFVGVDALTNDAAGCIDGGPPLVGGVINFIKTHIRDLPLHRGQVSVIKAGYPRPMAGETEAAFGYRQQRDAAHVDGVLAVGPARHRYLREPHSYILGLPLTAASDDAAPLVVWQGSHHIIRRAFAVAYANQNPSDWADIDITAIYQTARREVFETCKRIPLPARPGEATLVHRHTLHGVAPWAKTATADPLGRMIAYFRPQLPEIADWLHAA